MVYKYEAVWDKLCCWTFWEANIREPATFFGWFRQRRRRWKWNATSFLPADVSPKILSAPVDFDKPRPPFFHSLWPHTHTQAQDTVRLGTSTTWSSSSSSRPGRAVAYISLKSARRCLTPSGGSDTQWQQCWRWRKKSFQLSIFLFLSHLVYVCIWDSHIYIFATVYFDIFLFCQSWALAFLVKEMVFLFLKCAQLCIFYNSFSFSTVQTQHKNRIYLFSIFVICTTVQLQLGST